MTLEFKKNLPFILLTAMLFIVEVRPLVMQGMFFDGLFYFSIAWNMANHIGTLWTPEFNPLFFPHFFEHPPFGIFLQSLFFRLFHSSSIYIDKFCTFILALLNIFAIYLIWRKTLPQVKTILFWIPILIWLLFLDNFINIQMGFLEPILAVFTTFASFIIIKGTTSKQWHWFIYAGVLIVIAFLVKGLQAFFPLFIPGIYWLVFRANTFFYAAKQTILIFIVVGALLLLVLLYPPAQQNLQNYFDLQVLPSFFGHRVGGFEGWRHFAGLLILIKASIYPIAVVLIFFSIQGSLVNACKQKWVIFFFLVALSGSLPILLSSRQTGHYFYQAFPFLVLMFSHLLTPQFERWVARINPDRRSYGIVVYIMIAGLLLASTVVAFSAGKVGRDKPMLTDVLKLKDVLPEGSVLSISKDFNTNWRLLAYLYRYQRISTTTNLGQTYYLNPKASIDAPPGYHLEKNSLQLYNLYKKSDE